MNDDLHCMTDGINSSHALSKGSLLKACILDYMNLNKEWHINMTDWIVMEIKVFYVIVVNIDSFSHSDEYPFTIVFYFIYFQISH